MITTTLRAGEAPQSGRLFPPTPVRGLWHHRRLVRSRKGSCRAFQVRRGAFLGLLNTGEITGECCDFNQDTGGAEGRGRRERLFSPPGGNRGQRDRRSTACHGDDDAAGTHSFAVDQQPAPGTANAPHRQVRRRRPRLPPPATPSPTGAPARYLRSSVTTSPRSNPSPKLVDRQSSTRSCRLA